MSRVGVVAVFSNLRCGVRQSYVGVSEVSLRLVFVNSTDT